VVGAVGELLITAGVVVGLFTIYTLFWTGVETANEQEALEEQFSSAGRDPAPTSDDSPAPTQQPGPEPLSGDAYARLTIPRLGDDWRWIVVQGVDLQTLTRGPGHYPDTVDPGEVGNFAVAGHRATYGEPFANLDRVQVGDEVRVERAGMLHTYVVTESFITDPSDTDVLLPVPGQPGVEANEAVLTLTTCHPRWSSNERLIVHAALAESAPVEEVV
jgi:sortase A